MTIKQRLQVLNEQKNALVKYIEVCIFIKSVPKNDILILLKSNEDINALKDCINMFEETKKKYTALTSEK